MCLKVTSLHERPKGGADLTKLLIEVDTYKMYHTTFSRLEGAWIASDFFSNFQGFWYHRIAHIFHINPDEFYR